MQKFVSKYATAAHLALLAVAPLFLYPFFPAATIATVTLWLSLYASVWIVMEPSRRRREMPHDARMRVARSVVRDPLFWFSLFVVALAVLRWVNDGISLSYDAETLTWSLSSKKMPILPGSVPGIGYPLFASCVGVTVLMIGARHALGRSARLAFFVAATVLAGLSATVAAFVLSYGDAALLEQARCSYLTPSFFGTAYGMFLAGGVVALFGCAEMKWRQAEPLTGLGLICTAVGFVMFSPPATIAVFSAVFLLTVVLSFALKGRYLEGAGSFRCALGVLCVLLAVGALAFMSDPASPVGAKRAAFMTMSLFPEDFSDVRRALARIALDVWKGGPWLGSGLGSFPLDIRFYATPADWAVLDPGQRFVPSGWWLLIAERGVTGAALFAVGLGFLLWTYFSRMIRVFGAWRWQPMNVLALPVLAGLVALTFVDCSFMRADVLPVFIVFLALSAAAFPSRRKTESEE